MQSLFVWGWEGADAPTPARGQDLQPYGALTLFFRWRKKSVQKKASGTATPGKSPLLPILTAGLAMSRAAELASLRMLSCALGARLFPPSKWAGLFPSAAYRRSAPAQLAVGKLIPCRLGWIPFKWPQAHTPAPMGPDAPTPARIGTCRPKGRSHFSFCGERKVCKRKPAARRLREKALYCPF